MTITDSKLDIDTAIRIARLIAYAPEERLPIIVSVFEKADVNLDGLEELEELRLKNRATYIMDVKEFVRNITAEQKPNKDGDYQITPEDFRSYCKELGLNDKVVKRTLYQMEYIKGSIEKDKVAYSIPIYKDGELKRYVVIRKDALKQNDTTTT